MRTGLSADGSNGAKACVLSQHHRFWTGAMAVSRAQWCPRQQWLVAWSQTVPSVFSAQCVLLPKRPRPSIHHRVSAFTLFRALTRFREQLRAVASTAAQHALTGCCLACFFVFRFFFFLLSLAPRGNYGREGEQRKRRVKTRRGKKEERWKKSRGQEATRKEEMRPNEKEALKGKERWKEMRKEEKKREKQQRRWGGRKKRRQQRRKEETGRPALIT